MARLENILSFADHSAVPTLITDAAIRTTYVNGAFTDLTGYEPDDVIGKKPGDVLRGRNSSDASRDCFHKGFRDLVPFEVKVANYRKGSGDEYLAGIYVLPVRDSTTPGGGTYFVALQRELESPEEEILAHPPFAGALASVVDLLTTVDD